MDVYCQVTREGWFSYPPCFPDVSSKKNMETTTYFQNGFIKEQVGSCRLWPMFRKSVSDGICLFCTRILGDILRLCFHVSINWGRVEPLRTLRYSDTVQCRSQLGLGCAQQRRVFPVSQQGALSIWSGWWWFLKYHIFQYIASYNVYIYLYIIYIIYILWYTICITM